MRGFMPDEKDRQEEITEKAKADLEQKKQQEAKDREAVEGESKGAPADTPSAEEKTKGSEEQIKEAGDKAVAQAKADKAIMEKEEEELNEQEKARKAEIAAEQERKAAEEEDAKKKDRAERTEKRITELVSDIKRLDAEGKQKDENYKKLQAELEQLKKGEQTPVEGTLEEVIEKAEEERIAQYLEEDKDKPREQRREMSKDELEAWLMEDAVEAHRWIAKNEGRRARDRVRDAEGHTQKAAAEEFIKAQNESLARALEKHPDLDMSKRGRELTAQGKTEKEVEEILCQENPRWAMLSQIHKEDGKYLNMKDGPERAVEEMERRMKEKGESPEEKKKREDAEEEERLNKIREEAAEAERQRLARIDEGVTSTTGVDKKKEEAKTEFDKEQQKVAKKMGITPERLKELKDRRVGIPGVGVGAGT